MRALLFILLCGPAFGAYTISPSTIDVTNVAWGGSNKGFTITISGTGVWTLTANSCPGQLLYDKATGNAPDTMHLFYGLGSNATTAQSRVCDLSFANGIFLHVNETILPHDPRYYYTNGQKIADTSLVCTASNSSRFFDDLCPSTDPRPGGDRAYYPTTTGASYTDPQLGGVGKRVSAINYRHAYTTQPAMDLTETYIIGFDLTDGSTARMYMRDGSGAAPYEASLQTALATDGQNAQSVFWSGKTATVFYSGDTGGVWKYHLSPPSTVVRDGRVVTVSNFGYNPGVSDYGNIASKPSNQDWIAQFSPTQGCAYDLTGTYSDVCYSYPGLPYQTTYRHWQISPKVDNQGYYWIVGTTAGTNSALRIWKFRPGDGSLTLVWNGVPAPLTPGYLDPTATWGLTWPANPFGLAGDHIDLYVINGECWMVAQQPQMQVPTYVVMGAPMRLSAGEQMYENVEVGGGLDWQKSGGANGYNSTSYNGLTLRSYDQSYSLKTSYLVTAFVCGAGTCTVTLGTSTPGFSPGQTVWINAVGGITGLTPKRTVVTSLPNGFTFSASPSGSYTSGGVVTDNVLWAYENATGNEFQVCRANGHCRRLGKQQSVGFSASHTGAAGYFDNAMGQISPYGHYILYAANGGLGDNISDFIMPTGFDLADDGSTADWQFDRYGAGVYVTPGDVFMSVKIVIPAADGAGSCSFSASSRPDMLSPVTGTLGTSLGALERTARVAGFAAGTEYWYRAVCNENSVGTGVITTLPALSGSGALTVSTVGVTGVNNVIVDYDTSSGVFGNSTAAVSCSAAATCLVSFAPTRGLLYYRIRQRDSGNINLPNVPMPEFSTIVR